MQPGVAQCLRLTAGEALFVETVDQVVEEPVPIDLGVEVHEDRSQPDCGAIHEHEFARHLDAAKPLQLGVHLLRHLATIGAGGLLDGPPPVFQQRRIDEPRPQIEDVDHLARQVRESPGLVGMHGKIGIVVAQRAVEIDDAGDEARPKDPDAAEVEKIHVQIGPHRVVAEMGIAMDHAILVERHIPGPEHGHGDAVAPLGAGFGREEGHERGSVEPGHGEQPAGRQLRQHFGHVDVVLLRKHGAVKTHVARLPPVIELLAEPRADLRVDLARVDGAVGALVDGEEELELAQIRFDGRLHVGILKLDRERSAVMGESAVNLPQRCRRGGFVAEGTELALPARAELGRHPPLDERPAHRRCVGLKLAQLARILAGQGVGDGGEDLRHLHDRSLEAAERGSEIGGVARAVPIQTEHTLAREPGGEAAETHADLGIAPHPPSEAVALATVGTKRLIH